MILDIPKFQYQAIRLTDSHTLQRVLVLVEPVDAEFEVALVRERVPAPLSVSGSGVARGHCRSMAESQIFRLKLVRTLPGIGVSKS
jgi:hypothetical protein